MAESFSREKLRHAPQKEGEMLLQLWYNILQQHAALDRGHLAVLKEFRGVQSSITALCLMLWLSLSAFC